MRNPLTTVVARYSASTREDEVDDEEVDGEVDDEDVVPEVDVLGPRLVVEPSPVPPHALVDRTKNAMRMHAASDLVALQNMVQSCLSGPG